MFAILRKELHAYFGALMAYVVISFFLVLMGLWLWVFPTENILEAGYADLHLFFQRAPYILIFLIPAITMHLLSEEKRRGTLELLLTTGLPLRHIVLGKYLASLILAGLLLCFTIPYYVSIHTLGSPPGNVDTAAVLGCYLGLFCVSGAFAAVGIWASSFTEHQLVAFLIGVLGCFMLYQGLEAWTTLQTWQHYSLLLAQLGTYYHYESLSRGVIDSRDISYFLCLIFLLLWGTCITVARRR